jgi:DNA-directed RNA polymerase subunit beta'
MFDKNFDYIKISIAGPEKILHWTERKPYDLKSTNEVSSEVTNPFTINYKTYIPEVDGLFCEKIFGPVKDWTCFCGKYQDVKITEVVCEHCDVEVTESRVRRHRMGYINLNYPVAHIWYVNGIPSYLTLLLDTTRRKLKEIIYLKSDVNDYFSTITTGSPLIIDDLTELDLHLQITLSRFEMVTCNKTRRARLIKRIRVLENFLSTGTNPLWMMLFILPVVPPGLRPMIEMEGGQFLSSDLNEHYRRVIIRNNRLGHLLSGWTAPDLVLNNERRLIQEAVDCLIDNGKCETSFLGVNDRPLKSLADVLVGKEGRFRQNLLGKRVDYSGRSVIVVDPYLKLNQFGLPYEMAIELFEPFLIYELIYGNYAEDVFDAQMVIGENDRILFHILNKVLNGFPLILNRAPTLHRVSIQAFEPKIIEGRVIKLHPLVCSAFNADFDGDQMAIHLPLSMESQAEAYLLMLASNNIMALTLNEPIILPSQDMVLGCHYLTITNNQQNKLLYFLNFENAIAAFEHNIIGLQSLIWVKYFGSIQFNKKSKFIKSYQFKTTTIEIYNNYQIRRNDLGEILSNYILTTPGRIIMNRLIFNI